VNPSASARFQLFIVRQYIGLLNFFLRIIQSILFSRPLKNPKSILVYKVGNIGDIVCAIPCFIAIRRAYPDAKITLLTSTGTKSVPGAEDFLKGAWYFDEMKVYYSQDIDSWGKRTALAKTLRQNNYDLFIHIPAHDWTSFFTIIRNIFFAKMLGVKSAYGFQVRTVINLFWKTQIDYSLGEKEVDTLLDLLKEGGIKPVKPEFDFPISKETEEKVSQFIRNKWQDSKAPLIAILAGSKRKYKEWQPEKFGEVAVYLQNKYGARFVILGNEKDIPDAEIISRHLLKENALVVAGECSVPESIALTKQCDFFLGVDNGFMHIAAALGKPVVALFCILNIYGKWFPYGEGHECLYKRFLNCDYKNPECIKKSIEMISVDEVKAACDRVISRL